MLLGLAVVVTSLALNFRVGFPETPAPPPTPTTAILGGAPGAPLSKDRVPIVIPFRCREAVAFLQERYMRKSQPRLRFVDPASGEDFWLQIVGVNDYTSRPDRGRVVVQVWTRGKRRILAKADVWVDGVGTGTLGIGGLVLRRGHVEKAYHPQAADLFVASAPGHDISPPGLLFRAFGPTPAGPSGREGAGGAGKQ